MATVKITAGAESATISSFCRSCVSVAAVSDMRSCPRSSWVPAGSRPAGMRRLVQRDQRIERLVRIGASLIDALLLQDQILHRLPDELARLRIGHDGIADFGRALGGEYVERGLPFLADRLPVDPLAVFGIVRDGRTRRRN